MSRRRKTTEEDDLEEIRKGFEMFDIHGTGIIDPEELLEVMDSMNLKEKNPFIYEIIESLCSEKEFRKKGGVSLEDLVSYVYNKVNDTETNNGIRQIYDVINDRDTDTVSMSTFFTLAKDYGDKFTEDEIRYLLEKTQMGGEELTYDEFYTIMKGAKRSNNNNNSVNNIGSNRSSMRNQRNEVYVKKGSNNPSLNTGEYSHKARPKRYHYEEPKEQEQVQEPEPQLVPEQNVDKEEIVEVIKTNNLRYDQNDIEEDAPIEKEVRTEVKYDVQENSEPHNDSLLNYSYRKVRIGAAPISEKHVNVEEDNINNNLNINKNLLDDVNKNEGNYTKVRETKVTNLPDGGKEVQITEKTEIKVEKPVIRNRYRFSKKAKEEENNEDIKNETKPTYYRIRRPRGSEQKPEEQQSSKVEVEEKKEVIIPKRYHRRYRDSKNTNNEN
jgi:Ca2+-binding EF-hand superfamily protein